MPLPPVNVRPATPADCDLIWEWRNHPSTREVSFNSDPIPLEEHRAWFAASLKNRNRLILMVEADGEPVGRVCFDRNSEAADSAEVGIVIGPGHRGRGLGRAAIDAAIEHIRITWAPKSVVASVKPSNSRSIAAFEAVGFQLESEDASAVVLIRETQPPSAEEIKRFKVGAWSTDTAAELYERRIYKRSGVVRVKNSVEIGYAMRYGTGRVLDAGAGTGRFALPLHDAGRDVFTLDISEAMLRIARDNSNGTLPVAVGDLLNLPFLDDTFDSVISITVVEHLPQYREIFCEFVRVLKPGGTMVVQLCSAEHTERAGVADARAAVDFVVQLTGAQTREMLDELGLDAVEIAPHDLLNGNMILERCLGRACKPLWKLADKLLRLPLLARAFARLERTVGRRLPLWVSRSFIIVAKKRAYG